MVCTLPATTTCLLLLLIQGSKALTLTSIPVAEGDDITACSGTTVVVTCLATQVRGLKWMHPPSRFFFLKDYGTNLATTVIDPYTISLVNASSRNDNLADLVLVLEVMVNDIDNGTTVTCQTLPDISKSLTIYKEGPPSPPSNFKIMNYTYLPENLSILLSWEPQDAANIVSYRISINTNTPQEVFTNLTNITLEGEYNTLLEIGLFAMNCAGNSSKVTLNIYQEKSSNQPTNIVTESGSGSESGSESEAIPSNTVTHSFNYTVITSIGSTNTPSPRANAKHQTSGIAAGVAAGVAAGIIGVVAMIVFTIVLLQRRSTAVRKKPLGTNIISHGISNEIVTNTGIDAFYDFVRAENITDNESSLKQISPPIPFCEAKKQSLSDDQKEIHPEDDSCQTSHVPPAEKPPPVLYEDIEPIKQKTSQRYQLDTLESQEFNLPSKISQTTPPPNPPRTPAPYETAQSSTVKKHPLDEKITLDLVLQQMGGLKPEWRGLGRAADIEPSVLQEIGDHYKENEEHCYTEVVTRLYIPNKTKWSDLIAICDKGGFKKMSNDLQGIYTKGVFPVVIEEKEVKIPKRRDKGPDLPPRRSKKETMDKDGATPALSSPVESNIDTPPPLPPPLAPEDLPSELPQSSGLPALPPATAHEEPPARPPKPPKPQALTKL